MKNRSARRKALWACGAALFCGSAEAQENASQLRVAGAYVSDVLANTSGGLARGARIMGKADLIAELEFSNAAGAYLDLQYVHGDSLSGDLVGDAQAASNIDAPSALRPFEAYVHAKLSSAEIKAGLIDLNGDFDVQEYGKLFLNSSHGIGSDFSQSGLNGPSVFPTTASALTIVWTKEAWSARFGFFDAVAGDPARPRRTVVRTPGASGALLVGEADIKIFDAANLQLGAWTYTGRFDAIEKVDAAGAPARLRGNSGAYVLAEGVLAERDGQRLAGWVRVGMANDEINPISTYLGGGLSFGDDDLTGGIAVAHARLGGPARNVGGLERAETAVELTLAARINDRVTVQPDIQYISNPGWDPALGNALIAGVRLHWSLD